MDKLLKKDYQKIATIFNIYGTSGKILECEDIQGYVVTVPEIIQCISKASIECVSTDYCLYLIELQTYFEDKLKDPKAEDEKFEKLSSLMINRVLQIDLDTLDIFSGFNKIGSNFSDITCEQKLLLKKIALTKAVTIVNNVGLYCEQTREFKIPENYYFSNTTDDFNAIMGVVSIAKALNMKPEKWVTFLWENRWKMNQ